VRDPPSIIRNEQRRLILRPIDDVEKHSAPNHFSFVSSSVHFPLLGLPDAKLAFRAEIGARTINRRLRVAAGESRKAAGESGFLRLSWAG
jgi:hypothetical protein